MAARGHPLTDSLPEAGAAVALTTVVAPAARVCAVLADMQMYTRWCTWWLSLQESGGGEGGWVCG
jgi:hypothetical protein